MEKIIKMATIITYELESNFNKFIAENNIDMLQMKKICTLYQNLNPVKSIQVELDEIDFSSISPYLHKSQTQTYGDFDKNKLMASPEFVKKYCLFIKIIYCCLQLQINIFKMKNNTAIFKNNYDLKKSLITKKKDLLRDYQIEINDLIKNSDQVTYENLQLLSSKLQLKITILDKMVININKLVSMEILDWTDSLYGLILPYFYKYQTYIEEYAC